MTIIEYEKKYLPEVLTLHRICMELIGAYKGDGYWDDDLRNIETVYNGTEEGKFYLGLINDKVVAMGAFKKSKDKLAEVKRMRVNPTCQGKGYGKMIYEKLEQKAIELGYHGFHLETSELQKSAQNLYKEVGFIEYDRRVIDGYNCIFYKKMFPR